MEFKEFVEHLKAAYPKHEYGSHVEGVYPGKSSGSGYLQLKKGISSTAVLALEAFVREKGISCGIHTGDHKIHVQTDQTRLKINFHQLVRKTLASGSPREPRGKPSSYKKNIPHRD